MPNRKISATYVFPVSGKPIKNGIVEFAEDGTIVSVQDVGAKVSEIPNLEFYSGVLVPAFVNAHCHLELSYLKNKIPSGIGLDGFIETLQQIRNNFSQEEIDQSIRRAYNEMYSEGIIAVGDISNTLFTKEIKKKKEIYFHTFVECFSLLPELAKTKFEEAKLIYEQFSTPKSIVPHAAYSVSPALFSALKEESFKKNSIISFHNQECEGENDFFISKSGKLVDLFSRKKISLDAFKSSGKSSLASVYNYFSPENKTLLVHNCTSTVADIELAESYFNQLYWVVCPNSNIYLQNSTANIYNLVSKNCNIALGTDSLASNTRLSILEEMKTITRMFPDISFEKILQWATLNGAEALNILSFAGSLEIGKKPGILLLENFDFQKMQLRPETRLVKIVS